MSYASENNSTYSSWELYLEPCQTYMMEFFAKIVNSFQPLTISEKRTTTDVRQGSKYTSEMIIK